MIRLLAFLVVFYLLFKAARFFLRVLLGNEFSKRTATSQGSYKQQGYYRQQENNSVHIDYVPPKKQKKPQRGEFKGGEYIDFEEVD